MKARDYQDLAITAVWEAFKKVNATLLVLPTGCGKTVVFAMLIDMFLDANPGLKAIILAHREELIDQAADKIKVVTGRSWDVEMGERWAPAGHQATMNPADVLISSIQTQTRGFKGRGRMIRFDPFHFILQVIDEAHHATAASYKKCIDYYQQNPDIKTLGVTATPDRADEEALGQVFDSVAFVYELNDAIKDGWLVPMEQWTMEVTDLDFSKIKTTAGDLNGGQLEDILLEEGPLQEMTSSTLEVADGRQTLVFAATVDHAKAMNKIFNRHRDHCSEIVTGKTDKFDRKQIFKDFASKERQILVNVGVATEGFDCPNIEVISLCRPTKSRALFAQMCGRGTRALPGLVDLYDDPLSRRKAIAESSKTNIEIICFTGNCGRHSLMSCASILGGNYTDEEIERAEDLIQKETEGPKKPANTMDILDKARLQLLEELEEQKRKHIVAKAKFTKTRVDPWTVLEETPWRERGWDKGKKGSQKQRDYLELLGVQDVDDMPLAKVNQILNTLQERKRRGLCSYKMAKLLKSKGIKDVKNLSKEQAGALMGQLKRNHWRPFTKQPAIQKPADVPAGVNPGDPMWKYAAFETGMGG